MSARFVTVTLALCAGLTWLAQCVRESSHETLQAALKDANVIHSAVVAAGGNSVEIMDDEIAKEGAAIIGDTIRGPGEVETFANGDATLGDTIRGPEEVETFANGDATLGDASANATAFLEVQALVTGADRVSAYCTSLVLGATAITSLDLRRWGQCKCGGHQQIVHCGGMPIFYLFWSDDIQKKVVGRHFYPVDVAKYADYCPRLKCENAAVERVSNTNQPEDFESFNIPLGSVEVAFEQCMKSIVSDGMTKIYAEKTLNCMKIYKTDCVKFGAWGRKKTNTGLCRISLLKLISGLVDGKLISRDKQNEFIDSFWKE